MKNFVLHVDDDVRSVRVARAELLAWLDDTQCGDRCRDTLELVLSELVTNALTHGQSAPEIRAALQRDRIRLQVHDRQPVPPEMRTPQGKLGGFGMHIVASLVDDWGWEFTATGKVVWVHVGL